MAKQDIVYSPNETYYSLFQTATDNAKKLYPAGSPEYDLIVKRNLAMFWNWAKRGIISYERFGRVHYFPQPSYDFLTDIARNYTIQDLFKISESTVKTLQNEGILNPISIPDSSKLFFQ